MTTIEKLARLIVRTGNADQIMAALNMILTVPTKPDKNNSAQS